MALSLAVKVGSSVYIDDHQMKVIGQPHLTQAVVETDDGRKILLRDDRMVEVYPCVYVGVDERTQGNMPRLLFNAPLEIVILRQEKYRAQRSEPSWASS